MRYQVNGIDILASQRLQQVIQLIPQHDHMQPGAQRVSERPPFTDHLQ
jgi:hypothetical protein